MGCIKKPKHRDIILFHQNKSSKLSSDWVIVFSKGYRFMGRVTKMIKIYENSPMSDSHGVVFFKEQNTMG